MPKIGQRLSRRHVVEFDQGEKSEASCDEPSDGDVPMMDGDGETAPAEGLRSRENLCAACDRNRRDIGMPLRSSRIDLLSAENARTDAAMKNICRGC
jgi:hypothetical protein